MQSRDSVGDPFSHEILDDGRFLVRRICIDGKEFTSTLKRSLRASDSADADWWKEILVGSTPVFANGEDASREISMADLFCGSGGFSLGMRMAAEALGLKLHVRVAVDTDGEALMAYKANHSPDVLTTQSVMDLVDAQFIDGVNGAEFYYPPEILDSQVKSLIGRVDLVIGGPPCQGNSNLNNHTRRADPRNALYPMTAAVAMALGAKALLIENVPAVLRDEFRSVDVTRELLESLGWNEENAVLSAASIGWPQTRKRHFLAAIGETNPIPFGEIESALESETRFVGWAIDDLLHVGDADFMDQPSKLSKINEERIQYLFENDSYTLPDHVRPLKHQDGHSYPSSYGRMKWDEPSGTITTGFMSPGRGRFIHPLLPRALTPHEAARIQGFPDSYIFESSGPKPARSLLAKWIGDAVPAPLGYAAGFTVLRAFL
jgi:DNA (cytosine-5)-methyltransferase 1